ncbi:MAG: ABC-F family ATP-binding cassette domain-containing protein [Lachnospiraceae bacterium]|jgi:ATP-binding cassette subfamily F protein 3|nr:ABC-F family ATP-binding cassette domain-containing protein [Lachnospiraceae bacterium]
MILSCNRICKAFGSDEILKNASFHIEEHEKAAIVGINGAGKSTLLKIIVGELAADSGEAVLSKGKTFGYLAQNQELSSHRSIYDEMLEAKRPVIEMEERLRVLEQSMKHASGQELEDMMAVYSRLSHEFDLINGYAWKSEITGVLKGLGFGEDEFSKPISTLSGGQKTRISLGKLLLTSPDIILLDEPTNHLDMASITWLETYLSNYRGSVVIVAHDRYFLDRIVTKVIELDRGNASVYQGNYTAYSEKRAARRAVQMKAYLNQQQEIKHQEEVIEKLRSFNREKSIKRAESREKMLEKIERLEKPTEVDDAMNIRLEPNILSGNDVLTVKNLGKSFGALHLFSGLDFEVRRGERVAIIGDNGTGKTTILKIINGLVEPDTGELILGSRVHIGYYDQDHQVLHMEKTLFEEISDAYPGMTNTQIRSTLAAFLFTGDDVFKRIGDLSGGERGRVSLARLMLSEANFLILDEPTNHLDITSKEILENALSHYGGTILYVSHDRYFINKTATRILDLTGRKLLNYIGNYDYYLEKHDDMMSAAFGTGALASTSESESFPDDSRYPSHNEGSSAVAAGESRTMPWAVAASPASASSKPDWKAQKEEQARLRKRQNDLKRVEEEIHSLEARDKEIDDLLCQENVFTNVERLVELNHEKEALQEKLTELYEKWEELAE